MNHTETITENHLVKRLVWSCVLIAGLFAGGMPQANAHEPAYRASVHYNRHVVYDHHRKLPRWLRRDVGFKRWYWYYGNDRIRRYRHISWNRLYDLYLNDRYYHKQRRKHRRHRHYDEHYYSRDDRRKRNNRRRHHDD